MSETVRLLSIGTTIVAAIQLGASVLGPRDRYARIAGNLLVTTFLRLGPTYIKLGQVLASRPDLVGTSVARELRVLLDAVPPPPFQRIESSLRAHFGQDIKSVFRQFGTTPIASGSIACVYHAELHDGSPVAVKIIRPGIRATIIADLRFLRFLARCVNSITFLRSIPLIESVNQYMSAIERQLDLRTEANINEYLSNALAPEPLIHIPRIHHQYCGATFMTMELVRSDRHRDLLPAAAEQAAIAGLRALYRMIFLAGVVQGDPHEGNLLFRQDGSIDLLDFGFVAFLTDRERLLFAEFFYSLATNRGERCAKITLTMASDFPRQMAYDEFVRDMSSLIDTFHGRSAAEFSVAEFALSLFALQRRYRIRGTSALTLPIIALMVYEGRAKEFYPLLDFQSLAEEYVFRAAFCSTSSANQNAMVVEPK